MILSRRNSIKGEGARNKVEIQGDQVRGAHSRSALVSSGGCRRIIFGIIVLTVRIKLVASREGPIFMRDALDSQIRFLKKQILNVANDAKTLNPTQRG